MKIKSTFRVQVTSPDGDAFFTFRALKLNERFQFVSEIQAAQNASPTERGRYGLGVMLDRLVAVEGLEHEDGKPVSVDEVKNLEIDAATIDRIALGFVEAIIGKKESPEKKSLESA